MNPWKPNPYSPFATADPQQFHLDYFGGDGQTAGGLALTACEAMAVTPDPPVAEMDLESPDSPQGVCALCYMVWRDEFVPVPARTAICDDCGSFSSQGRLCAVCRQDHHDRWVNDPSEKE